MAEGKRDNKEMTDREATQWFSARVRDLEETVRSLTQRNLELYEKLQNTPARLTPLQIETRDRLLQTMLDLIPAAQRAARRGKPGLLRLIARTLRIKF